MKWRQTIVAEIVVATRRGGRNNNPEGHNQYSSSVMSTARENPLDDGCGRRRRGRRRRFPVVASQPDQRSDQQPRRPDQRMARRHDIRQRFQQPKIRFERAVHASSGSSTAPRRPEESGAVFGRSADAEGDRQDRLGRSSFEQIRGAPCGAPLFHAAQEIRDRFAELRLGDRAHMRSRNLLEQGVGKDVRELLG